MAIRLAAQAHDFSLEAVTPRRLITVFGAIAVVILACLAVAALADVALVDMFRENGPIEAFQAALYGVAALCFAAAGGYAQDRLHRLTFVGLALFVACLMLRELDFTHSQTPTLALIVNGPAALVVVGLAWVAFAVFAWRSAFGLVVTGLLWVRGRGGLPLLAAAVLLLAGSLFDHHAFPIGRTADMIGEEALELVAGALVLLSAIAALRVSRAPARA